MNPTENTKDSLAYAMKILLIRDRSEHEMRQKLAQKSFTPAQVEQTVAQLKSYGYINDRKFALHLAGSMVRNGRGYGYRIKLELQKKGVKEEHIEAALEEVRAQNNEEDLITDLVLRKFSSHSFDNLGVKDKKRIIDYLARKGFTPSTTFEVLRKLKIGQIEDDMD